MTDASASGNANPAGIVLHHLDESRSQRILWLLEELEVPYTIKVYKRNPDMSAPKELLEVHPLGKAPVLTDGPLTLSESGAIVEYLISRYGKQKFGISDETSQAWIDNVLFTHYAEGSLQPLLVQRLINQFVPKKAPGIVRPLAKFMFGKLDDIRVKPDLEKSAKLIEDQLAKVETKGGWLAGTGEDRPTSADFMMSISLQILLSRAPEYAGPRVKKYVLKFQERPAYKKALEKGGELGLLYKGDSK